MPIIVTKATPAPGLVKRRADPDDHQHWSATTIEIRSCMYCKTIYRDAGAAWVCEHHHNPVPRIILSP